MHVTVYDHIDDVPQADWDAVVDAVAAPVFYRYAYLSAYARSGVSTPLASRFVLVRDRAAGRPLAACPATLQQPADPLGVLDACFDRYAPADRSLLTHVWQCYDSVLPAVSSAAARTAFDTVAAVAEVSARWAGVVNVGTDNLVAIRAALGEDTVTAEVDERFRLDLTGLDTLEDYLATLSTHAARNLRRYLHRGQDRGVTVAQRPAADAALDEAITLIRATAERHGNAGMYPDGPFQDFVRRLGDLVTVIEIRDAGRLIGVGLCLLDRQRFHLWTAGAAPVEGALFSPYGLVFVESMRAAIASGKPLLEGGRRNRYYKERHGLTRVALHAVLREQHSLPDQEDQ